MAFSCIDTVVVILVVVSPIRLVTGAGTIKVLKKWAGALISYNSIKERTSVKSFWWSIEEVILKEYFSSSGVARSIAKPVRGRKNIIFVIEMLKRAQPTGRIAKYM